MVKGEIAGKSATDNYIPSYVGLSCAVSGYRHINKYDAASRDGSATHNRYSRIAHLSGPDNIGLHLTSDLNRNELLLRNTHLAEPRIRSLSSDRAFEYKKLANTMETASQRTNLNNGHMPHHFSHHKVEKFSSSRNSNCSVLSERCTNGSTYTSDSKSFIQQRIERLYGSSTPIKPHIDDKEVPRSADNSPDELPSVFRHLRPEFRHQLPIRSRGFNLRSSEVNINQNGLRADSIIESQATNGSTLSMNSVNLDKNTTKSEDTTDNKSWQSLKKDIQSVKSDLAIPNNKNLQNLDLNKNVQPTKPQILEDPIPKKVEKDGHYFLKVVEGEVAFLEQGANAIEEDLKAKSEQMSEDVKGKLLATTGKANLLVNKKIKQFRGLCQKNIAKDSTDEFPTTNEDLAGFWDMVLIQVESVKEMLVEADKLKKNDWKEKEVDSSDKGKVPPKVAQSKKSSKATKSGASNPDKQKANDERRKQMREALIAKRKEATKLKEQGDQDVIFM